MGEGDGCCRGGGAGCYRREGVGFCAWGLGVRGVVVGSAGWALFAGTGQLLLWRVDVLACLLACGVFYFITNMIAVIFRTSIAGFVFRNVTR